MKKWVLIFWMLIAAVPLLSQTKQLVAFPITDYMVKANDSLTVVQVKLAPGLSIAEKAAGILRAAYSSTDTSTAELGTGKGQLIKADYYYFGIFTNNSKRKPKQGDLVYTFIELKNNYAGLLFKMASHNITINSVEENLIIDFNTALNLKDAAAEKKLIDSMVNDVVYTGKVMMQESNNQDMDITSGRFKGKRLFATMQTVTGKDVTDFIKYIIARPKKYAGNTWKFSEIFATWMTSGAPTVIENN
jgi:hypothetical protein